MKQCNKGAKAKRLNGATAELLNIFIMAVRYSKKC